jgi:hypothetical protein
MERAKRSKDTPSTHFTHWTSGKIEAAFLLALMGATEEQMAKVMEVSHPTIVHWKKNRPEFRQALLDGKLGADTEVLKAAYKCATGYFYEEEVAVFDRKDKVWVKTTVKRYRPPDPWSAFKWLSVRQRDLWSETNKVEVTHTQNMNISMKMYTTEDLLKLEEIIKRQPLKLTDTIEPDDGDK